MRIKKAIAIILSVTMLCSGVSGVALAKADIVKMATLNVQKATSSDADLLENEEFEIKDTGMRVATPSEVETIVNNEEDLRDAINKGIKVVEIDGNIKLTQTLFIHEGADVYLSGGTLSCGMDYFSDSDIEKHMIILASGAKLTLSDIEINATGWGSDHENETFPNVRRAIVIYTSQNSEIIIEDGTSILCESEGVKGKLRKRGIFLRGKATMNGGEIIENGNYEKIEGFFTAGAGIQGEGYIELNDGMVASNEYGTWILGEFKMNGGEICHNEYGIYNATSSDGEAFAPESIIRGGRVYDNDIAITNEAGGIIVIEGDAEIEGVFDTEKHLRSAAGRVSGKNGYVIKNDDNAQLKIRGGQITSSNPNEIAVYNTATGKLNMDGGIITAAGVALRNENTTAGAVQLTSGTIQVTSETGTAIDNQGYIKAGSDMVIEAAGKEQYLIAVSYSEGGTVSPSTMVADKNAVVSFTITPDSGYKISDVKLDGKTLGVVSSCNLTVEKNHELIVEFVKKSSSGGSSGGGGSSSSSTAPKQSKPETPGSWSQDQIGWRLVKADGSVYENIWVSKNNLWYWIGIDSYMKTGWNQINGAWYYLMPVSGEMKTGWVQTDGQWRYLSTDGKMLTSAVTPDGYNVDATGVWIQ